MASTVRWHIKLYDLGGNPIDVDYSDYVAGGETTNEVVFASNRSLTYMLNSVDECSFDVALNDPAAFQIRRLKTVVKIFREVNDPVRGVTLLGSSPSFCGIVGGTTKSGASNIMTVKAFNPLWRLQFRFHILNHYLETNPDTGDLYTQSELIWKLIDLINGAFGVASFTGIDVGTFEWGLPDEPQMAPTFVAKATKTWSLIFDTILNRPGSVDIFPVYQHTDGDPTMMLLNTMEKRGLDKSSALKLNYHTDPTGPLIYRPNLDDLTEESSAQPDEFANYVWAVGKGGPNSGKVFMKENASFAENSDGYGEIGIYMSASDHEDIEKRTALTGIAQAELEIKKHPQDAYTVSVSPAGLLYYDYDYVLGDVCALNADRGALQISDKKQRIHQVTLSMSANNLESADLLLAYDFFGKVAGGYTPDPPPDVDTEAPAAFTPIISGPDYVGSTLGVVIT